MRFVLILFIQILIIHFLPADDFDLIWEINEYREANGLPILIIEDTLNKTAALYARELMEQKRISHVDKKGRRVLDRYRAAGGTASEAGEILGTSTDRALMFSAWQESSEHNQLILDPKWMRIGASTVEENSLLISVVLFSISLIDEMNIEKNQQNILLNITAVEGKRLFFDRGLELLQIEEIESDGTTYSFCIESGNLPVLLPLYGEIGGVKKITDFLYVSDNFFPKTY